MPRKFDCLSALRALGEENRIRILRLLLAGEHCVNEIAEALGITQYNISRHLKVLKSAQLVEVTRLGQQRIYNLAEGFRGHLSKEGRVLDLGCCQFDFSQLPK